MIKLSPAFGLNAGDDGRSETAGTQLGLSSHREWRAWLSLKQSVSSTCIHAASSTLASTHSQGYYHYQNFDASRYYNSGDGYSRYTSTYGKVTDKAASDSK